MIKALPLLGLLAAASVHAWGPSNSLFEIHEQYVKCGDAELRKSLQKYPLTPSDSKFQRVGMAVDTCETLRKALYGQYISDGGTVAAADAYAASARLSYIISGAAALK